MGYFTFLLILLFTLCLLAVLTQAATKNVMIMVDTDPCQMPTKSQMRRINMKYWALVSSGRVSRLGALYDADALLVTASGKAIQGSDNIQNYYTNNKDYSYFLDANSASIKTETFVMGCNMAQYSYRLEVDLDSKTKCFQITISWIYVDGKWMYCMHQISCIACINLAYD